MNQALTAALLVGLAPIALADALPCPARKWDFAIPTVSGWNTRKLSELEDLLKTLDTTALTIVHRGRIVFDYGKSTSSYNVHSARKSIMSILYGIAVSKGSASLTATVGSLGIDDKRKLSDIEKSATMQQLLQARSCIYHLAEYETDGMASKRPARHSCKPGERWYYNNWDFNALGTAYKLQTGKSVFQGFDEELAKPLRMEQFDPRADTRFAGGSVSRHPGYPIWLSAHDFARVGLLMSRGGNWCGKQILPADWVNASTTTVSATDRGDTVGYGYMWWTSPQNLQFGNRFNSKVFSARGHLGQYLVVVPGDDLVIAHLTDGDTKRGRQVSTRDFGRVVTAVLRASP